MASKSRSGNFHKLSVGKVSVGKPGANKGHASKLSVSKPSLGKPGANKPSLSKLTEKKPRPPTFAELMAGETRFSRAALEPFATPTSGKPAARGRGSTRDDMQLDIKHDGERYEGSSADMPGRVIQELKKGKHRPDLTIDVHGLTSDQAVRMIDAVLRSAVESDLRTLLIVYGRGLHSPEGPVLPRVVVEHLSRVRAESILALTSAPAKWGGPGALLVRLRRPR
jgi:DNA-nicking Smr family endonuclease